MVRAAGGGTLLDVRVLARALDVPGRAVSRVSGERARRRRLRIDGLSPETVQALLAGTTT